MDQSYLVILHVPHFPRLISVGYSRPDPHFSIRAEKGCPNFLSTDLIPQMAIMIGEMWKKIKMLWIFIDFK